MSVEAYHPARTQRTEEAFRMLTEGVGQFRTSDDWAQALRNAAKFWNYSFHNSMLLAMQAYQRGTEISRVAGYGKWKHEFGRQVKAGEKGYMIFAPLKYKTEDVEGNDHYVLRGFKIVYVFDINQTIGEPITMPADLVVDLEGEAPEIATKIAAIAQTYGFDVMMSYLPKNEEYITHGVTDWRIKRIMLNVEDSPLQQFKTGIHELAHMYLHDPKDRNTPRDQPVRELEAESVAWMVCHLSNIDTDSYSFPYITHWTEDLEEPGQALLAAGNRVMGTAKRIIERMEV